MHPPRIAASALILGVLVSGCTPTSPPTMPTSTVTVPTCTPEFGGDPYPCTQAEYERSQQTKARYAEAERVYREFNARSNDEGVRRLPEPSEEVLALTAGTLRQNWPEIHRASLQGRSYAGTIDVVSMRPSPPGQSPAGSLAMVACVDYSHWTVAPTGGPQGKQVLLVHFDVALASPRVVSVLPAEGLTCDQ